MLHAACLPLVLLTLLLALLLVPASDATAREIDRLRTPGAKDLFRRVEAAWTAGSARSIVALVPTRGSLSLHLYAPRTEGTFRRAQAENTLKQYFLGVTGVRLKDVTERKRRSPRDWLSRTYEYTYRPRGRDPAKTLLIVTMKGDGRGTWTLNSIAERPLPEQR